MKKTQSKAKRKSSQVQISDKEIANIQEILLKGVLLSQPLPGSNKPIRFPDLSFILNQPTVKLMEENLMEPISIMGSPKPIQLVSRSAAIQEARTVGDIAFLYFHPAKVSADEVDLILEGKMIPHDPGKGELGLSSIHVKFRKIKGKWVVIEEPIYSAA